MITFIASSLSRFPQRPNSVSLDKVVIGQMSLIWLSVMYSLANSVAGERREVAYLAPSTVYPSWDRLIRDASGDERSKGREVYYLGRKNMDLSLDKLE